MKTTFKFFIGFFLFLATTSVTIAQSENRTNDLSKEEMAAFKERAKLKVDQFNNYISFISKKYYPKTAKEQEEIEESKDAYIEQACELFIGNGRDYYDADTNYCKAPQMETSSINRATNTVKIKSEPVADYLVRMKGLRYNEVYVTASDAYFISEARKVGENQYEATLSYTQTFYGLRDKRIVYRDQTDKTIKVYITRIVIDGRIRWDVLLGDIKVDATI